MYDYITQEAAFNVCQWDISKFHLVSDNIALNFTLYAHTVPAIIAFIFGLIVFIRNRDDLLSRLLFVLVSLFLAWSLVDLSLYATESMRVTMGMWSLTNYLDPLMVMTSFLMMYAAIYDRLPSWRVFAVIGAALLPLILLGPTTANMAYFDLRDCAREAGEGALVSYVYSLDLIVLVAIALLAIHAIIVARSWPRRNQIIRMFIGIAGFILLFSSGNIIGSLTYEWDFINYALFAMPLFAAFLSYNIINNQRIQGRMAIVYALIFAQFLLLGSVTFVENRNLVNIISGVALSFSIVLNLFVITLLNKANYHRREIENLLQLLTHQIKGFFAKTKNIFALALEGEFGELSDQMKRMMQEGLKSDTKGVNLVEAMLRVVRVRQGTAVYLVERCDITDILRDVIEDMHTTMDAKGLSLAVALAPLGTTIVAGDPFYLRQALKNVIDNAVNYTPKGSVHITSENTGTAVRICISDTGVGIAPDDMHVMFTEGGHGKDSQKVNVESTGYGLYITKHVLDAHYGSIKVESAGVNKGSKFTIELPLIS